MKRTEKYNIGNRQYVTGESDLLCEMENAPLTGSEGKRLYRTKKGVFFMVCGDGGSSRTKVDVVPEDKAHEFMDRHTAGIITDTYDKVFGTPEKG